LIVQELLTRSGSLTFLLAEPPHTALISQLVYFLQGYLSLPSIIMASSSQLPATNYFVEMLNESEEFNESDLTWKDIANDILTDQHLFLNLNPTDDQYMHEPIQPMTIKRHLPVVAIDSAALQSPPITYLLGYQNATIFLS
jgi:hypothetical protein